MANDFEDHLQRLKQAYDHAESVWQNQKQQQDAILQAANQAVQQ